PARRAGAGRPPGREPLPVLSGRTVSQPGPLAGGRVVLRGQPGHLPLARRPAGRGTGPVRAGRRVSPARRAPPPAPPPRGERRRCQASVAAIFRDLADPEGEGRALNGLGLVLSNQERLAEAAACYERSLRLLVEAGDRHSATYPLSNIADDLCSSGRLEEAAA